MSPRIGEPHPWVEEFRATAHAGGRWFLGEGPTVTVIGEGFSAHDCEFQPNYQEQFATFVLNVSDDEGHAMSAPSPTYGWVGWLNGDTVIAMQHVESEQQSVGQWRGISPFSVAHELGTDVESLPVGVLTECFARLAMAILLCDQPDQSMAVSYLSPPRVDGEDG